MRWLKDWLVFLTRKTQSHKADNGFHLCVFLGFVVNRRL